MSYSTQTTEFTGNDLRELFKQLVKIGICSKQDGSTTGVGHQEETTTGARDPATALGNLEQSLGLIKPYKIRITEDGISSMALNVDDEVPLTISLTHTASNLADDSIPREWSGHFLPEKSLTEAVIASMKYQEGFFREFRGNQAHLGEDRMGRDT
jgi:hypothetical protein